MRWRAHSASFPPFRPENQIHFPGARTGVAHWATVAGALLRMTERTQADLEAAARRVSHWCGEPLLHEGEDATTALAPDTPRRLALEAALDEIARGRAYPSYEWRRDYALMLGLDRVLSEPQPRLASGTTLRRHQVDA